MEEALRGIPYRQRCGETGPGGVDDTDRSSVQEGAGIRKEIRASGRKTDVLLDIDVCNTMQLPNNIHNYLNKFSEKIYFAMVLP